MSWNTFHFIINNILCGLLAVNLAFWIISGVKHNQCCDQPHAMKGG